VHKFYLLLKRKIFMKKKILPFISVITVLLINTGVHPANESHTTCCLLTSSGKMNKDRLVLRLSIESKKDNVYISYVNDIQGYLMFAKSVDKRNVYQIHRRRYQLARRQCQDCRHVKQCGVTSGSSFFRRSFLYTNKLREYKEYRW
jgi:hypothetical protein